MAPPLMIHAEKSGEERSSMPECWRAVGLSRILGRTKFDVGKD